MPEIRTMPFSPFPVSVLKKLSKPFIGIGVSLEKSFPYLSLQLEQAEIDMTKKEYTSITVFLSFFYFLFFTFIFALVFYKVAPRNIVVLTLSFSLLMTFLIFIQLSIHPAMLVKKKVRGVEKNLVFALRTILVQLKSGVSLFSCLNMISYGNYGILSQEIKKTIDEISTGTTEQDALQQLATKNPSPFLRKSLWQIINGMKAGADVGDVLTETVSSMIKQQSIEITRFGSKLRLLSLFYMMVGVIIPALGITFLIILGSFPQITITEFFFWVLLAGIILFQFMFLGLIKSARPNLLDV